MFTLYTKDNCPMCDKAKNLLTQQGISFTALKLGTDISREELLAKIPNARTMPQILKDGQVIGGFTELKQMLAA
jgi:glutaredoxin 3